MSNHEPSLGKQANRRAIRKIGWFCCTGHDGWINRKRNKKIFNRIARRTSNLEVSTCSG